MIPFLIDNEQHRLADVLNALLERCAGGPLDIATAYFAVSGLSAREGCAARRGGLSAAARARTRRRGRTWGCGRSGSGNTLRLLRGDLDAEPFTRTDVAAGRGTDRLSARPTRSRCGCTTRVPARQGVSVPPRPVGPHNRERSAAALCRHRRVEQLHRAGLASNRELNLVHRVFTPRRSRRSTRRRSPRRSTYLDEDDRERRPRRCVDP